MNKQEKNNLPLLLLILDGWGLAPAGKGNAISLAKTPNIDNLLKKYPNTSIYAHGSFVGLPPYQDGNSEAGHMNIGAGRVVEQDSVKIGRSINEGTFFKNPAFQQASLHVKKNKSKLHLIGLLSNGMSAHSDPDHLIALLAWAHQEEIKNVRLHLFTDGRDSHRFDALKLFKYISQGFKNNERIASICGRFFAMDRTGNWERLKKAYDLLVYGKGIKATTVFDAITESYNKNLSDEFIEPYVITNGSEESNSINDNDAVIFFNLRSDRARELTRALVDENFDDNCQNCLSGRKKFKNLCFVAMTDFGVELSNVINAYPSVDLQETLPNVLKDFSQLYIAETEKYGHVTYFFNGGYNKKLNGEDYKIIESPRVRSYDTTPKMSSDKLREIVLDNLKKNKYDFTVLNFAAPDMVGHTGNLEAGIKCCEIIDEEVGRLVRAYLEANGTVLLTADHGNIEEMLSLKSEEVNTEHTTNPVFFVVINEDLRKKIKLRENGVLADVAPTILDLLKIKKPQIMTGKSLIKK